MGSFCQNGGDVLRHSAGAWLAMRRGRIVDNNGKQGCTPSSSGPLVFLVVYNEKYNVACATEGIQPTNSAARTLPHHAEPRKKRRPTPRSAGHKIASLHLCHLAHSATRRSLASAVSPQSPTHDPAAGRAQRFVLDCDSRTSRSMRDETSGRDRFSSFALATSAQSLFAVLIVVRFFLARE
jgi:hypothetical protein